MEVADGLVVTLEYTVRLADGTVLDSTSNCGPMAVMIGSGQLFPALEDRMFGMLPGETRQLSIPAADAYRECQRGGVRRRPRGLPPPAPPWGGGHESRLKSPEGRLLRFGLRRREEAGVEAVFTPPQAGQELRAMVTVVAVRP